MTAFDAFISYSHAVDGRLPPALKRAIQRLIEPHVHRSAQSAPNEQHRTETDL